MTLSSQPCELTSQPHACAAPRAENPRCLQCEACTQSLGNQRHRCLVRRAREAAAAGSEGGWLAVHGAKAIGARVSVWWPLDEAWYDGVVSFWGWLGGLRGAVWGQYAVKRSWGWVC